MNNESPTLNKLQEIADQYNKHLTQVTTIYREKSKLAYMEALKNGYIQGHFTEKDLDSIVIGETEMYFKRLGVNS